MVDRWAEHFQTLLNQPATPDLAVLEELPSYPAIEELDLPPTFSEVLAAIRSLKNNKTPGPDGIPAEILEDISAPEQYTTSLLMYGNMGQFPKNGEMLML